MGNENKDYPKLEKFNREKVPFPIFLDKTNPQIPDVMPAVGIRVCTIDVISIAPGEFAVKIDGKTIRIGGLAKPKEIYICISNGGVVYTTDFNKRLQATSLWQAVTQI